MAHIRIILFTVLYFAVTDLTLAAIPEYIKICKRDQNTINECVRSSIEDLRPHLAQGIPELSVPSIDPMRIAEINLDRIFQGYIKNVELYGLSKYEFKKIHVDLDSKIIKATLSASVVRFTGDCSIDAQILSIPIKGKGPISANLTDCELDAGIKYNVETRDGHEYIKITSCDVELRVGDYDITLDGLFKGNASIGEAAAAVIDQRKQDLLAIVMPIIKEAITKEVLGTGNKIAVMAKYDEVLPKP